MKAMFNLTPWEIKHAPLKIKIWMEVSNLTNIDLASRLGKSNSHISNILSNQIKTPEDIYEKIVRMISTQVEEDLTPEQFFKRKEEIGEFTLSSYHQLSTLQQIEFLFELEIKKAESKNYFTPLKKRDFFNSWVSTSK